MSNRTKNSSRSAALPTPPKLSPPVGDKSLQERLHILLTHLATTTDLIKTWPESDGDDASVHVETTTKLITAVLSVVTALQKVEGVIKADAVLKRSLQECKVPINLLDLLDHGNGLNPDCFSRGLLKEALGQLAGLKRRKLALEMLGAAIQTGLNQRDVVNNIDDKAENVRSQKRKLGTDDEKCGSSGEQQQKQQQQQRPQHNELESTLKKTRM
mmetsp:Transcript_43897/g.48868  ORF Transcript_43897/g.48868 Transcript_43897/m.48868 type:complete len:214 (-) Transcript_43897:598-1239(-)